MEDSFINKSVSDLFEESGALGPEIRPHALYLGQLSEPSPAKAQGKLP